MATRPAARRRANSIAARLIAALAAVPTAAPASGPADLDLVDIPAGVARLGDPQGEPDEQARTLRLPAFRIMRREVTNAQFARFVAATGDGTDAERAGNGYVWRGRWRLVTGADWRHPRGRDSGIDGKTSHPVVQVSARDAAAFCRHHGLRLPTAEEWEYAARGTDGRRYPWGDGAPGTASGRRRANFGTIACCAADAADGFRLTAPVGRFPQGRSPFGLDDMAGNVWEWTASAQPGRPGRRIIKGGGWGNNPYCLRAAYAHANPADIGLDMVGFRCAGPAD